MCVICHQRQAVTRAACRRCYSRLHKSRRLDELPPPGTGGPPRHDIEDCRICDEVQSLAQLGFTAAEIVSAIGKRAETLDRHLTRFAPHLRPAIADAYRREAAARSRNRRTT